jgi:hypothetical protein
MWPGFWNLIAAFLDATLKCDRGYWILWCDDSAGHSSWYCWWQKLEETYDIWPSVARVHFRSSRPFLSPTPNFIRTCLDYDQNTSFGSCVLLIHAFSRPIQLQLEMRSEFLQTSSRQLTNLDAKQHNMSSTMGNIRHRTIRKWADQKPVKFNVSGFSILCGQDTFMSDTLQMEIILSLHDARSSIQEYALWFLKLHYHTPVALLFLTSSMKIRTPASSILLCPVRCLYTG